MAALVRLQDAETCRWARINLCFSDELSMSRNFANDPVNSARSAADLKMPEPMTSDIISDPEHQRRLELLEAYDILDTQPEPEFDDIVAMAAAVCKTPVALISLVERDRQWFKAKIGFEACDTPIDQSVCVHALSAPDLLIIPDLASDPRTRGNTLVTAEPGIRFYAGAPLLSPNGTIVGTLCVIDTEPRPDGLDETQRLVLSGLARQVVTLLEARRVSHRKDELFQRQKGLSASIRTNANKYLAAQEAGRVGTFDIDLATGEATVSAEFCRIFDVPVALHYPASLFEANTLPEDRQLQSSASTRSDGTAATNVEYRIRTQNDGVRWIARNANFERDASGNLVRFLGTVQDITEQKKAAIRVQSMLDLGDRLRNLDDIESVILAASDLMAKALDATRAGFGLVDPVAETVSMQPEWRAPGIKSVAGIHRFRTYGSFIDDLKDGRTVVVADVTEDPRTRDYAQALLSIGIRVLVNLPIFDHGAFRLVVFVHHERPYPWTDEELAFIRGFGDRLQLAIARLQAERDQDILNREIGHRLKNTFAMIQAIANQTLRPVAEREHVQNFERRLHAMSFAHDLLLQGEHAGASVGDVVKGFAVTLGVEDRIEAHGPDVIFGARATLSLSLLLHELGTNAIKYGALSSGEGRVMVSWKVQGEGADAQFALAWEESGGPPVHQPRHKGFGSKLIGMGLTGTGGVTTHYHPSGFSAHVAAALAQLQRAN